MLIFTKNIFKALVPMIFNQVAKLQKIYFAFFRIEQIIIL